MNAQQVYTKYLNKEFTDKDLLYHMRRDPMLKEYISPVNNSRDVITILKNRGIIWEQAVEVETEAFDPFSAFKSNVKEDNFDSRKSKDFQDYTDYVININKKKIVSGWEFRNDAMDDYKEIVGYGNKKNDFRVVSRRALEKLGLDPKDDKNWGAHADRSSDDNPDDAKDTSIPGQGIKEKSPDYGQFEPVDGQSPYNEGSDQDFKAKEIAVKALAFYKGDAKKTAEALKSQLNGMNMTHSQIQTIERVIEMLNNGEVKYDANKPTVHELNEAKKEKAVNPYKGDAERSKTPIPDTVNYYEFYKGWNYELQLPALADPTVDQVTKAKDKALKNLGKNPTYYSNLFAKNILDKTESNIKITHDESHFGDTKGPVDKVNGMKPVKVKKLREDMMNAIKNMIREDAGFNANIQQIRAMKDIKPEELAKQVLADFNRLTPMRKEFAAKLLGGAIADGNSDQTVADAFHKLSDDLNIKKEDTPFEDDDIEEDLDPKTSDFLAKMAKSIVDGKARLETISDQVKKRFMDLLKLAIKHGNKDKNFEIALRLVKQASGSRNEDDDVTGDRSLKQLDPNIQTN